RGDQRAARRRVPRRLAHPRRRDPADGRRRVPRELGGGEQMASPPALARAARDVLRGPRRDRARSRGERVGREDLRRAPDRDGRRGAARDPGAPRRALSEVEPGRARVYVRRMRADDVAGIEPVLRAAYAMPRSYRERIEAHLRQRNVLPLIAECGGRPAGAVFGNDYATSAYVSLMGVDPALHGRGIGTALMTGLMAWCDERGFRDVRLDATPLGAPLYERFGFRDFGETIVYARERVVAPASAAR